jgi:hypothetical protein
MGRVKVAHPDAIDAWVSHRIRPHTTALSMLDETELARCCRMLGEWMTNQGGMLSPAEVELIDFLRSMPGLTEIMVAVARERARQIMKGYDDKHDDKHGAPPLAYVVEDIAGVTARRLRGHGYAQMNEDYWQLGDPRDDLVKAGAVLVAAIGVMDREAARAAAGG